MRRTILLLAFLALTTGAAWRRGDAYVLHAGKTSVTMTSVSIRELPALLRRLGDASYLWVRLGSREWLIRDEALLRGADVFEDLRFQRLGSFEATLVAHPM